MVKILSKRFRNRVVTTGIVQILSAIQTPYTHSTKSEPLPLQIPQNQKAHSEAYPIPTARPTAHSEAKVLTARPRHIYHMPPSDNPYEITSQPILQGKAPTKTGYTLRVVALWFIFTVLLFV